jgi:hypothetical protein
MAGAPILARKGAEGAGLAIRGIFSVGVSSSPLHQSPRGLSPSPSIHPSGLSLLTKERPTRLNMIIAALAMLS